MRGISYFMWLCNGGNLCNSNFKSDTDLNLDNLCIHTQLFILNRISIAQRRRDEISSRHSDIENHLKNATNSIFQLSDFDVNIFIYCIGTENHSNTNTFKLHVVCIYRYLYMSHLKCIYFLWIMNKDCFKAVRSTLLFKPFRYHKKNFQNWYFLKATKWSDIISTTCCVTYQMNKEGMGIWINRFE